MTLMRTLIGAMLLAPVSVPALATVLAQDDFDVPPYSLGPLNGQAATGTDFTGVWSRVPGLQQDLTVVGNHTVGRPTVAGGNSGDFAVLASPIAQNNGQLFISMIMDITPGRNDLTATRLDFNLDSTPTSGDRALLGGVSAGLLGFATESGLGTPAAANSSTFSNSGGPHHLVGVLDATNDQIAIFVDPTASSFYNADGSNNADGTSPWLPASSLSFNSLSLIENLGDQVTFSDVIISNDPFSVGVGVPEPASLILLGSGLLGLRLVRRRKAV